MTELERARAHLQVCQKNLLASRQWDVVGDTDENAVLAALSWVSELQESSKMIGQTFGSLTVIASLGKNERYQDMWLVRCNCCEKQREVRTERVISAGAACTCEYSDRAAGRKYHGLSKTPEYKVWEAMKRRCRNFKDRSFKYYGGRGVIVCERWRYSFANFLADMGSRPSPDLTVERRNNDGNYEPSNCYWATRTEQRHNRRDAA